MCVLSQFVVSIGKQHYEEKKLNCNGQQFHQYQQNEQSLDCILFVYQMNHLCSYNV